MRKRSDRALRIAALVKCELVGLLRDKVRDPRIAGVSISDVEVSRDLSFAKVYLLFSDSVNQTDDQVAMLSVFNHAAGFLRVALSNRLQLRKVPKLKFINDETQLRSKQIEELLAKEKQRK